MIALHLDPNTVYAVDVSMAGAVRIVGADAPRFVRTMYSGSMEHFDELFGASQGMLLNSEGQIIDMVGVVRTGDDECLMLTSTENVSEVVMWLQAHAELEDSNGRIFPDVLVEDHSMKLAMMLLYGKDSPALMELMREACRDRVFMIECSYPHSTYAVPRGPGYLIILAPNVAAQIGDFLNQQLNVEVLSLAEYTDQLRGSGQVAEAIENAAYVTPQEAGLSEYLRDVHDFVGAKALGLE